MNPEQSTPRRSEFVAYVSTDLRLISHGSILAKAMGNHPTGFQYTFSRFALQ
jgi:hypothetical protein